MKIGVYPVAGGGYAFRVWAPLVKSVSVKILGPRERPLAMERDEWGYWEVITDSVVPGTHYLYRLEDERDRPDPASHFQPQGVHGPSEVIGHDAFEWEDEGWRGLPIAEMVMYELHTGTFTPEGTFDAIIPRLDEIRDVGMNTLEIMPVVQFPGERNWGYDGAYPFSVHGAYGGPQGLKRLVNECHKREMAVILDVVYNHLGPEGNYLWDFGPYFTDRYKTPWGWAVNFDGPFSNDVRNYFIENAFYWCARYHIDALRLDAIHSIYDMSARPFLQELAERVRDFSEKRKRRFFLIAESNLNDSRVIRPRKTGGYELDAEWCDDFHHSLHTLLTEEDQGYYVDFGSVNHLVTSIREGFVYSGQYSRFRNRNHGNSSKDIPAGQFIVFSQNHDQTGNRMLGERLSRLVSFEALKLAAGAVLLSPYVPLLFMGEEYGETAPFLYFVSHSDPDLVESVRKGRKEEFRSFHWDEEPPDPQSAGTFERSKLTWSKRSNGIHQILLACYKELLRLRKSIPPLSHLDKKCLRVRADEGHKILVMERWKDTDRTVSLFNFSKKEHAFDPSLHNGEWEKVFDSSDERWNGPGSHLPGRIASGDAVRIRSESCALYLLKS